jgi:hypothetical protein
MSQRSMPWRNWCGVRASPVHSALETNPCSAWTPSAMIQMALGSMPVSSSKVDSGTRHEVLLDIVEDDHEPMFLQLQVS